MNTGKDFVDKLAAVFVRQAAKARSGPVYRHIFSALGRPVYMF